MPRWMILCFAAVAVLAAGGILLWSFLQRHSMPPTAILEPSSAAEAPALPREPDSTDPEVAPEPLASPPAPAPAPTAAPTPVGTPPYTVKDRVQQYGAVARSRLEPYFEEAGVPYPPRRLCFVGLKDERLLEIYAAGPEGDLQFIRSYPILAASGRMGPKLREGDRQVPEGIYDIELLNPNSRFHLSLRISYPNSHDRARAAAEKRSNLGGDIMIHGKAVSIGCLAIGDEPVEDLFVLAAETGHRNIRVILSPVDFRKRSLPELPSGVPEWTEPLYETIRQELAALPSSPDE